MSIAGFLSKREIYSDFPKDLTQNPITLDLSRKINEDAVKESLKNLILTGRGERLFNPDLGCGIRQHLFEALTPDRVVVMREMITETIENYEPRVALKDVDILSDYDTGVVVITLIFNVINIDKPITYAITINRTR